MLLFVLYIEDQSKTYLILRRESDAVITVVYYDSSRLISSHSFHFLISGNDFSKNANFILVPLKKDFNPGAFQMPKGRIQTPL